MVESKVKIGVIGAGWWAVENHIPVLKSRPDVHLAGVCRPGKGELDRIQQRFEIDYGTGDYQKMVDGLDLDGVVVSSPHHLHYEHARAALEKGISVLCEKPMTLRTEHARELVDLVRRKGLHFLIPYGWNYEDFALDAKSQIDSGAIGSIRHLTCQMAGTTFELFSGMEPWFVKESFVKPEPSTWSDARRGGGYGHGQTTHLLGLLLWITGLEPAQVYAEMGLSVTQADLFHALSARFTNGATATISGSAGVPKHLGYQIDVRVFGTDGMLLLDLESGRERLEIRRRDQKDYVRQMTTGEGTYACVKPLYRFVDLIQGKPVDNRSPVELGARVVELLDAAYRSAQSGRPESVPAR